MWIVNPESLFLHVHDAVLMPCSAKLSFMAILKPSMCSKLAARYMTIGTHMHSGTLFAFHKVLLPQNKKAF